MVSKGYLVIILFVTLVLSNKNKLNSRYKPDESYIPCF